MKRVKACLNLMCDEYKKGYYKETDKYCIQCGHKLSYVCRKRGCYKLMPEDCTDLYCPTHQAEKDDANDRRKDAAMKVGGGVLAAVATAAGVVKTVAKLVVKR